jgi:hypothetical protein
MPAVLGGRFDRRSDQPDAANMSATTCPLSLSARALAKIVKPALPTPRIKTRMLAIATATDVGCGGRVAPGGWLRVQSPAFPMRSPR